MADREKIINAIEKAKKQSEDYAQDTIIVPFKEADMILALPKEQKVDTSKYQYKYDHTDCIWYSDSRSRCPPTCSQYRDGWNDAMDFIFKNGVGYRPYKRR